MKTLKHSLIIFFLLTVLLCGVYPMIVMGISHTFFPIKSSGGILVYKDRPVGAELIAQEFTDDKYFWSRPSAAGFNASASSGTNYALTNNDYQKVIKERKSRGLDMDLLSASASGLDPHISVRAAQLQVDRISLARGLEKEIILKKIISNTEPRQLGFLGEVRVNVLKLNLELEKTVNE